MMIQLRSLAFSAILIWTLSTISFLSPHRIEAADPVRPNILWITCEDISPHLRCYGDEYAMTPNLDRLAAQGIRYTHAFATSGVCAPARSCLITGVYPSSMGTHFMRCTGKLPAFIKCFPEYLRAAGYYCTNKVKTDYNFRHPKTAWDESSRKAHWRNRKQKDQPFFSVFNFTVTHESKTRARGTQYANLTKRLKPEHRRDPAKAVLPPYYPDTPEARRDWANNAELITVMDMMVGDVLKQLDEDGLTDDTIVFYYSDHGIGLPRAKRWIYDSGIHVPLIIRFPKKLQKLAGAKPCSVTDRLVSFVDFAPTVLSLAGVKIPSHMQGKAFLGEQATEPRQHVFAIRDRMDERYDMIRAVRDHRFKYIRNYMPHVPYAQYIDYAERGHTLRSIRALQVAGKLTGPPSLFLRPTKPAEELYDTKADPHEIRNLADSPEHQDVLHRMRRVHESWATETIDLGLLPEPDLRKRTAGTTAYEWARRQDAPYPRKRIVDAANLVRQGAKAVPQMRKLLAADDPAVRCWAAIALLSLGRQAEPARQDLLKALADPAASVRVQAAHALCKVGGEKQGLPALVKELQGDNEWVRLAAVIALDSLGGKARPALAAVKQARDHDQNRYVVRVASHGADALLGKSTRAP